MRYNGIFHDFQGAAYGYSSESAGTPSEPQGELGNVCRLLSEHEENGGIRFTYNQGELEILVPSVEHETLTSKIETLVELIADGMELDFIRTRSTTFRHEDLEKGFEPDSSFYFQNVEHVRGKKRLNLKKIRRRNSSSRSTLRTRP